MTSLNNYYSEIRSDIAKDFGLESAGYAPSVSPLPIRIAQRIANKYPSDFSQGRFNSTHLNNEYTISSPLSMR